MIIEDEKSKKDTIEELNIKVDNMKKEIKVTELKIKTDKNLRVSKMKDEMLEKIKKIKDEYMGTNTEQLNTLTQMTILQNNQLTNELEYQSNQTENLNMRNKILGESIKSISKDIELHQEVEKELAKRSNTLNRLIHIEGKKKAELVNKINRKKAAIKSSENDGM